MQAVKHSVSKCSEARDAHSKQSVARLASTFAQIHNPIHHRLLPRLTFPGQPMDLNAIQVDVIHVGVFPQTEMYSGIVGGEITAIAPHPASDACAGLCAT